MAVQDDTLLIHSDTDRYQELGSSIETINRRVASTLSDAVVDDWVGICDILSDRGVFLEPSADRIRSFLHHFKANQVVHGHSTLRDHFGLPPDAAAVPHHYADGHATAIDGGVFDQGRLILADITPAHDA